MSKMQLDIVTPERKLYSEEVEMVITRAAKGDIGILPQHAPLISPLAATVVRIKKEGIEEKVTILADAAEFPHEIDVTRAERAKARAKQRLAEGEEDAIRAEAALVRAVNRLRVVRGGK
jgi:F-type H+-transporting ATPase subunit epsilon